MTATYRIPDDVNAGSYPSWVVNPFVPIIAGVLTSYLIGLIWLGLNAKALGLRNLRKHLLIIGVGAFAVVVLQASGIWLATSYEAPDLNALWGELIYSLAAVFAVGVFAWGANVQQVPSGLYTRKQNLKEYWGLSVGGPVALYLLSYALGALVFMEETILRRVLLG